MFGALKPTIPTVLCQRLGTDSCCSYTVQRAQAAADEAAGRKSVYAPNSLTKAPSNHLLGCAMTAPHLQVAST